MKKKQKVMGPSELGEDMTKMIEEKLVLYADKVRFRAVCKSWNSITPKMPNLQTKQLPWFLHSVHDNIEASHGLLNPLDNKVYLVNLPKDDNSKFVGSTDGWVVFYDRPPILGICLMNPLTGSCIQLPTGIRLPDTESNVLVKPSYLSSMCHNGIVRKVVWSSAPMNDDCVVVASYFQSPRNGLVYCKPQEDKWTNLYDRGDIMDVLFHKGKLHALRAQGELTVFEGINRNSKYSVIASKLPQISNSSECRLYLVESLYGSLMMVEQDLDGCRVYKHDVINLRWLRFKNIGDEIIFLGHNSSCLSISCSGFPGLEGNRIYFLDNFILGGESYIKVFNLVDETIEVLSAFKCRDLKKCLRQVWVTPRLC